MTKIKVLEKVKLKNPVLIEGLPGIGNIGRVAVSYLIEELKAKKFAELYSRHFFPFVMLKNDFQIHLLKNEFYYWRAKEKNQRDLIFLVGDSQSLSPEGHYEICENILDFVKNLGTKEIFTVGGLGKGELIDEPRVIGAATDDESFEKYKNYDINFEAEKNVGYIAGAAGLLLGIGKEKGMKGICLLGETSGFPIVTDPKAAEAVLNVLVKILNVKIDMTKLKEKVKEMEKFIKKAEDLQREALMNLMKRTKKPIKDEQLRYIG